MKRSIKSLSRAYQDQTLGDDEIKDLDQILATDSEAREVFMRETNLIAALEDVAVDESAKEIGFFDRPTASQEKQRSSKPFWTKMAFGAMIAASIVILLVATVFFSRQAEDRFIATIVGLSGPLQWTGDGGQVRADLDVGMKLSGGTIDGLTHDSWFALVFRDGSKVVISGNSMLAFSDAGQKKLHLKLGTLSADVEPQPEGFPMLIHTPTAVVEVVGTSFEIDTDLESTALSVSKRKVQVMRLSDGNSVEVPSQHQVVAAADQDLSVNQIPQVAYTWRSRLEQGPRRTYGRWIPGSNSVMPRLHCIAHTVKDTGLTIYAVSTQVTAADAAAVMTNPRSGVHVQGRLDRESDLFVGMTLRTRKGEFAGRFQVRLPAKQLGMIGDLDLILPINDFKLDPSLKSMKHQLPDLAHNLVVESLWCHTLYQQAGLSITSLELSEREE